MNTMTTFNTELRLLALYTASNKKEVILAMQGLSSIDKVETIKSVIDLLNAETDMLIKQGINDIAVIKMAQVVMLEEVEMLIERVSKGFSF